MTLWEAMDRASRHSEAAELLQLDETIASADEQTALGELIPTLTANGALTRNQEEVRLGEQVFVNLWDYNANAQLRIEIFRAGAISDYFAASRSADSAEYRASWERAALRLAAGRAYLASLTASANVDVARESLAVRQRSLEQTQVLAEVGYALSADVSRARLAVIESETALLDAENRLADALDVLSFVVNVPELTAADLDPDTTMPQVPILEPSARSDLRALDLEIAAQRARRTSLWLTFLPSLTITGQYDFGRESIRAPDGTFWTISLTATWLLFDYGRYGRLDASQASIERLQVEREQALRQLAVDRATYQRRLEAAEARVTLTTEAAAVADEARTLVLEQYQEGEVTTLELTEADDALFRARVDHNLARLQRELARLEMAYTLGALDDRGFSETTLR